MQIHAKETLRNHIAHSGSADSERSTGRFYHLGSTFLSWKSPTQMIDTINPANAIHKGMHYRKPIFRLYYKPRLPFCRPRAITPLTAAVFWFSYQEIGCSIGNVTKVAFSRAITT